MQVRCTSHESTQFLIESNQSRKKRILDCCTDTAFIGWTPMEVFGGWASSSRGGCVNPSSLQPSSWACCFTPRASPDLAPTNVTYFTRPDLTPTAYRLNILGRQSDSNSHSISDLLICNFFSSSHNSSHLQCPVYRLLLPRRSCVWIL